MPIYIEMLGTGCFICYKALLLSCIIFSMCEKHTSKLRFQCCNFSGKPIKKKCFFQPKRVCQSFCQNRRQWSDVQEPVTGTTTTAASALQHLHSSSLQFCTSCSWASAVDVPTTRSAFMWWSNQLISTGKLSLLSSPPSPLIGLVLKKQINESTKTLRPEWGILIVLFSSLVCQPNRLFSS